MNNNSANTFIAVIAIMGISGIARAYFGIGAPVVRKEYPRMAEAAADVVDTALKGAKK